MRFWVWMKISGSKDWAKKWHGFAVLHTLFTPLYQGCKVSCYPTGTFSNVRSCKVVIYQPWKCLWSPTGIRGGCWSLVGGSHLREVVAQGRLTVVSVHIVLQALMLDNLAFGRHCKPMIPNDCRATDLGLGQWASHTVTVGNKTSLNLVNFKVPVCMKRFSFKLTILTVAEPDHWQVEWQINR